MFHGYVISAIAEHNQTINRKGQTIRWPNEKVKKNKKNGRQKPTQKIKY